MRKHVYFIGSCTLQVVTEEQGLASASRQPCKIAASCDVCPRLSGRRSQTSWTDAVAPSHYIIVAESCTTCKPFSTVRVHGVNFSAIWPSRAFRTYDASLVRSLLEKRLHQKLQEPFGDQLRARVDDAIAVFLIFVFFVSSYAGSILIAPRRILHARAWILLT